jgi:putative ABC transport system permease protein
LGEGARRYISGEFVSLGTNLLIVFPGRNELSGGLPPLLGETPRDLTLDDARALLRSARIDRVAPLVVGVAPVSFGRLEREVTVIGTTADFGAIRQLAVSRGRFLPPGEMGRASPVVVMGPKLRDELFGKQRAVGRWARIGDRRFRVIGILETRGQSLGMDLDDIALVPVASAQALFNAPSLVRIFVAGRSRTDMDRARQVIRDIIRERHEGEEDITVVKQDALLNTFDRILTALTFTVGGIAAVSLVVAGVLIMNVTLVAVSQRTEEIGLLTAIGATPRLIRLLFLSEAGLLSLLGSGGGMVLGLSLVWLGRRLYPSIPFAAPVWAIAGSLIVALLAGLLFALLPAGRAARLDPVIALAGH